MSDLSSDLTSDPFYKVNLKEVSGPDTEKTHYRRLQNIWITSPESVVKRQLQAGSAHFLGLLTGEAVVEKDFAQHLNIPLSQCVFVDREKFPLSEQHVQQDIFEFLENYSENGQKFSVVSLFGSDLTLESSQALKRFITLLPKVLSDEAYIFFTPSLEFITPYGVPVPIVFLEAHGFEAASKQSKPYHDIVVFHKPQLVNE